MANPRQPRTIDEILESALEKEQSACEFYADLAAECQDSMVRELLIALGDEERRHVRKVQEMLTRLRLGRDVV